VNTTLILTCIAEGKGTMGDVLLTYEAQNLCLCPETDGDCVSRLVRALG